MRAHKLVVLGLCSGTAIGAACSGGSKPASTVTRQAPTGGSTTGGVVTATCPVGTSSGPVQSPVLRQTVPLETGWFASPLVVDLDKDGKNEIVTACYAVTVFDSKGKELSSQKGDSRAYAPHVVTDLEGDGVMDIVVGRGNLVEAFEWRGGALTIEAGWPADTTTAGSSPEVRGLAVADLDGNGSLEVVATTTQTADTSSGGAQVFVWNANGTTYQPAGLAWNAWPRYNNLSGPGNDGDDNGQGNTGYGCYGLNVGIGNIDDQPDLEVIVTYDNHQIPGVQEGGGRHQRLPMVLQSCVGVPEHADGLGTIHPLGGPEHRAGPLPRPHELLAQPWQWRRVASVGRRPRPTWSTSTATGSTKCWACPTSKRATLTSRRRTPS